MLEFELIKPRHDRMPEECGVFGAFNMAGESVLDAIYYGLYAIQHRGQESAGIAISDGEKIRNHKAMGLVTEVFNDEEVFARLNGGHIGIGHVRYSTSGASEVLNAQPLVVSSRRGEMALAHNGNLVNADTLRDTLQEWGHINQTTLDTEVIAHLIARFAADGLKSALKNTLKWIRGSYALVIATHDSLIGIRDPYGIRPLCLGKVDDTYVLSSESCSFDAIGAEFVRDIKPGEMVIINNDGLESVMLEEKDHRKLCIFEFVYFARTDSLIDGISVYQARENAGKILAKRDSVTADLVSGVPDSAITAAIGYSKQADIPYGEGLAKNRYVGRTFIKPQQSLREQSVKVKLNALKRNVDGKKVVLVDDSIVRGTTSRKIVEMLRESGVKEVHMRISSPPVRFPCFFGIDTPSASQLIGSSNSIDQIAELIGVDSLSYLTIEELLESVGGTKCQFCTGCFDGDYPLDMDTAPRHCPDYSL